MPRKSTRKNNSSAQPATPGVVVDASPSPAHMRSPTEAYVLSFPAKRANQRKVAKAKRRTASGVVPSTIRARSHSPSPAPQKQVSVPSPPKEGKVLTEMIFRQMELKDCAPCYHLGELVFTAKRFPSLYRTFDQFEVVEKLSGDSELCYVVGYLSLGINVELIFL